MNCRLAYNLLGSFGGQFLGLLLHFFNGTNHVESNLGFCEIQYKRTEQSFKINSVNAEWCNIQSCINYI
ncbi:hypothetical protein BpHYR1_037556 [Brachionus plicatilis]|uniref:Uncharacterized protein n=1 Tax=Brachionus plicatilis TaxID=10195 RepID=A0A3M7QIA7_BRAPC|nr:hypothetical protein BpHYR1_037556 [Brachionus plicatilis]